MHNEVLTLATICGGAVQEKMDRALEKVAKNILDPNTDPGKKRIINLKITMRPKDDDPEDVEVNADVTYTLAPEVGVQTQFFVNKDLKDGKVTVMEHKRGEIKGQLDFTDLGLMPGPVSKKQEEPDEEAEAVAEETADVGEAVGEVLDFRRKR